MIGFCLPGLERWYSRLHGYQLGDRSDSWIGRPYIAADFNDQGRTSASVWEPVKSKGFVSLEWAMFRRNLSDPKEMHVAVGHVAYRKETMWIFHGLSSEHAQQ